MSTLIPPQDWPTTHQDSPTSLCVASLNTLRRGYGFHGKYWVNESWKEWSYRLPLLHSMIESLHVDILCMQEAEVTTFESDFGVFVKEKGYLTVDPVDKEDSGHVHTKPSIVYNPKKLHLEWVNPRSRTMIASFTLIENGRMIIVANCHLQGGGEHEDQRFYQLKSTINQILVYMKEKKLTKEQLTCFICGDLNSNPGQSPQLLLSNGKLSQDEKVKFFGEKYGKAFNFNHNLKFEDSYEKVEPRPITFKWGVDEDGIKEKIDYIFYTPLTLSLQSVRDTLSEDEKATEKTWGLPNARHPSDHLPVAARFNII